jgi:hypothetical protein
MSLPFFDSAPVVGLAEEERAKLTELLGELEGLKRRLNSARR